MYRYGRNPTTLNKALTHPLTLIVCLAIPQVESAVSPKSRYRCCCRITRRTPTMLLRPKTLPQTVLRRRRRAQPHRRQGCRITGSVELRHQTPTDLRPAPACRHDVAQLPAPALTTQRQPLAPTHPVRSSSSVDPRTV